MQYVYKAIKWTNFMRKYANIFTVVGAANEGKTSLISVKLLNKLLLLIAVYFYFKEEEEV